MSRDALRPLTSLRFCAAMLVFLWHLPQVATLAFVLSFGYAGVGFFFLLSGFILTYSYREAFDGRLTGAAMRAFYVARIARIYPVLAVSTLITLGVLTAVGGLYWNTESPAVRAAALVAQLTLLQSWFPATALHFGINGPAWSLSVEAFFYALFPFIAAAAYGVFRTASPYRVLGAAFALWVGLVALAAPFHARLDEWGLYVFPPARLVDFTVGILLGVAFHRAGGWARSRLRPTSLEILALAAAALSISTSPFVPLALHFAAWLMPAWCAMILVFARQRGAVSRLLSHPVAVRLGEISYAFYLSHHAVITFFRHTLGDRHPLLVPIALAVTLTISFALYHAVEEPLRARIRALLSRGGVRTARERAALAATS